MAKKKKNEEEQQVEAGEELQAEETTVDEAADEAQEADESGSDAEPAAAEAEVDYQAEADKNKDLYLRSLADLENYRKRAQREKEEAIRYANSNLLREMIPVIDNLERAVEHANGSENQDKGLLEGVEMTLVQFQKVLESFGVKVLTSVGEPFNPEFHQAMGELETADYPPNSVAQEMQKGYTLNDRLLRPALVMIAKAPAAAAVETETEETKADPDATPDAE